MKNISDIVTQKRNVVSSARNSSLIIANLVYAPHVPRKGIEAVNGRETIY